MSRAGLGSPLSFHPGNFPGLVTQRVECGSKEEILDSLDVSGLLPLTEQSFPVLKELPVPARGLANRREEKGVPEMLARNRSRFICIWVDTRVSLNIGSPHLLYLTFPTFSFSFISQY